MATLQRHPQTGVTEWHSATANGVEWDLWVEEFMLHQVNPQGEEFPTRLVVANLLQHLSKGNREFVMKKMRRQGILGGLTSLQRRVALPRPEDGPVDRPPAPPADPAAAQLDFLLAHFSEEPEQTATAEGEDQDPRLAPPLAPAGPGASGLQPAAPAGPVPVPAGSPARQGTPGQGRGRGRSGGRSAGAPLRSRACECGNGVASFGLPGAGKNGAQWCADCPSLPGTAVEVGVPHDVIVADEPAGDDEDSARKDVCNCGLSKPVFGLRGSGKKKAIWCAECPDLPPMAINVFEAKRSELYYKSARACECQRAEPSLALPGEAARWCPDCPDLPPDVVSVKARLCECGRTVPFFALPGRTVAIWCERCPRKPKNAMDLKASSRCECGKAKIAKMGLPGERPRWCKKCPTRPQEAVNVVNPRCACGKSTAIMGMPQDLRSEARWCKLCAPLDAINLKERRCECGKGPPKLGLPGSGPEGARWCHSCPSKPLDATDVVSPRCECGKQVKPRFGLPGKAPTEARWCAKCPSKPPNAIDMLSRRCECGRGRPSFGLPGGRAVWCSKCPARAAKSVDVVNRRCECGRTLPAYGMLDDGIRRWCAKCPNLHPSAVNLKPSTVKCSCERKRKACFALPGEPRARARWCADCPDRPQEAVDVVIRRAKSLPVAAQSPI